MSKKDKEQELIKLLQNSYPSSLNGNSLARNLNITTRTVRNYVNDLNKQGYQISSSKNGYKYLSGTVQRKFALDNDNVEILLRLLKGNKIKINKVKLENEFFISETTLRRKINEISEYLSTLNLKLKSNDNHIYISGNERNKRHLIYLLLNRESKRNILKELKISSYELTNTKKILKEVSQKYNLDFDTGTFNNIFMHLSVSIFRLKNLHEIDSSFNLRVHDKLLNSKAYSISKEIADQISKKDKISFNANEIDNIALLLLDTIKFKPQKSIKLSDLVDSRYLLLSTLVINMIDKNYNLQLSTDTNFISRFALHIQNLNNRISYKNDRKDIAIVDKNIKKQFPFIYEIAVFACSQLSDIFEHTLSENEINLIALHLGTLFMNAQETKKQSFILIDENYLNSNENIVDKFNINFANQAEITEIFQNFNQITKNLNPLRILSTSSPLPDVNMIQISPFMTKNDIQEIKERIDFLNNKEKEDLVAKYFMHFLPKSLLFREKYFKNYKECIHFLCQQMQKYNNISNDFEAAVLKREKLSSTDFVGDIAIPHPLSPINDQTTIAMIINRRAIKWNKHFVHIIMLLGLSENDKEQFQTIMDAIVSTFTNSNNIKQIISSKNYHDIVNIFKSQILSR